MLEVETRYEVSDVSQLVVDALNLAEKRLDPRILTKVHEYLEAIPMSTSAFALSCRRLENAIRYLHFGEFGAAKWEIRALKGRIVWEATLEPFERAKIQP